MVIKKKQWAVWALAFCLGAGALLTGCSGKDEQAASSPAASATAGQASASADPYDKLPRNVSISTLDRGAVSSDQGTYENNRWVKWIGENSGINVKIIPVPRNQAQDKLNVLIASNQAPDLIWEFDRTYIGKLVSQGAIQPIDEYIEKYSTSYKKYLNNNPELKPFLTFNGKMYAVASKRDTVANHGLWIRQDWLDKLGLKMPTTVEELVEVAKAFKDKDPDGNGKADTTPLVGSTTFDVYSAMFAAFNNQWYLDNGKMVYGALTDRFGDAMALEKQMYELGLIDKEYMTDKNFQRAIQLWTTGKAGIYAGNWNLGTVMTDLLTNNPNASPVPLEPVTTKYGKFGLYQEAAPNMFVAFNKDMKNPKAAVEYLDWMIDKGWKTLLYGEEGVHYKDVNGVAQTIDADKLKKEVSYAGEYAVLRQNTLKPADLPIKAAPDALSQRIAKLNQISLETAMKNAFRRDIPYQPNFTEFNEIQTSMKPFLDELRAKVTMQGSQYTAAWGLEEVRKEWKRLGGDKVTELAQQWYESNKASFK
jgi:putative aldouronate transport system substrate-binding protein